MTGKASTIFAGITAALEPLRDPERAVQEKRYLKSTLTFMGVGTPALRGAVKDMLQDNPGLERHEILALAYALWAPGVHELRAVAMLLLEARVACLEREDLAVIERLIRESASWAYVDALAVHVAGRLVTRFPSSSRRWTGGPQTPTFGCAGPPCWRCWSRCAVAAVTSLASPATPTPCSPRRSSSFGRRSAGCFARSARSGQSSWWISSSPRLRRVSGLTLREAVKHLPPAQQTALHGREPSTG